MQQLLSTSEALKFRNETLSADVARLNEVVQQHVRIFVSLLISLNC